MWFLKKKIVTIGAETDEMLLDKLKGFLANHNAVLLNHDNYVVGS